jgi:hypothetical protein
MGIYDKSVKAPEKEYYLKLTMSKNGKVCVTAVDVNGNPIPNGRLFVFLEDYVVNVSNLNTELGFRTDKTGGILVQ